MTSRKRVVIYICLIALTCFATETAFAACNSTVNGGSMSPEQCAWIIRVYGNVVAGDYAVDDAGNWINIRYPQHRGNIYRDAQRQGGHGGSWGGDSYTSPNTVYDGSGGCEAGSCVNIID
jgi:hypothetical protein